MLPRQGTTAQSSFSILHVNEKTSHSRLTFVQPEALLALLVLHEAGMQCQYRLSDPPPLQGQLWHLGLSLRHGLAGKLLLKLAIKVILKCLLYIYTITVVRRRFLSDRNEELQNLTLYYSTT